MKIMMAFMLALSTSILLIPVSGDEIYEYVTSPERTNALLSDFDISNIERGENGFVNFILKNPYNHTIYNITLFVEICSFFPDTANPDHTMEQKIDRNFSAPPVFVSAGSTSLTYHFESLNPTENRGISMEIETQKKTPAGTYNIRFSLSFDYPTADGERTFIMKSVKFFSDEEWGYATKSPEESDMPYYNYGMNTTYLGIDTIIPGTAFSVIEVSENNSENSTGDIGLPFLAVAIISSAFIFRKLRTKS